EAPLSLEAPPRSFADLRRAFHVPQRKRLEERPTGVQMGTIPLAGRGTRYEDRRVVTAEMMPPQRRS
ncbi:MAG: hypothetical protein ACUVQK_11615, partial [Thermogutta sp.]